MIPLTKRKLLQLGKTRQHKRCAELLRAFYENQLPSLEIYQQYLSWLNLPPFETVDKKSVADRYHWHLEEAGKSLKEHNLLPKLRTGDGTPKADFLPVAIYLDHIRSAHNVGSILRTCEALRIGSVYFSERTPFHDNDKVIHTAMGAAAIVPCFPHAKLIDLPRPIIALETSDEALAISDFVFPPVFTLVLGNEEYGVSDEALTFADALVEIPLLGAKNSLNVACAFAIAAAEIRKRFALIK